MKRENVQIHWWNGAGKGAPVSFFPTSLASLILRGGLLSLCGSPGRISRV